MERLVQGWNDGVEKPVLYSSLSYIDNDKIAVGFYCYEHTWLNYVINSTQHVFMLLFCKYLSQIGLGGEWEG